MHLRKVRKNKIPLNSTPAKSKQEKCNPEDCTETVENNDNVFPRTSYAFIYDEPVLINIIKPTQSERHLMITALTHFILTYVTTYRV